MFVEIVWWFIAQEMGKGPKLAVALLRLQSVDDAEALAQELGRARNRAMGLRDLA